MITDTFLHKGQRAQLVKELRNKGIDDESVLRAFTAVPRHLFVDSGLINLAYEDKALPIKSGQTISQPYTVAFQTQLLQVKKGDKILEIGTGSGFQTAILLEIGATVYTIERHHDLFLSAQQKLKSLQYNPFCYYGDGYEGLKSYGPYDKILITAAAPHIPEKLLEQLKVGGIMVVPIGDTDIQNMKQITKTSMQDYSILDNGAFVFVPMLKGKA